MRRAPCDRRHQRRRHRARRPPHRLGRAAAPEAADPLAADADRRRLVGRRRRRHARSPGRRRSVASQETSRPPSSDRAAPCRAGQSDLRHRGDARPVHRTDAGPADAGRGTAGTFPIVAFRVGGQDDLGHRGGHALGRYVRSSGCATTSGSSHIRQSPRVSRPQCATSATSGSSRPCSGLGTPVWDFGARGTLVGLTRGSGRPEIVRAVLEGVAHRGADLVEASESDSGFPIAALRVDGGMSDNAVFVRRWPTQSGARSRSPPFSKPPRSVRAFWPDWPLGPTGRQRNWLAPSRPAELSSPQLGEPGRVAARERWLAARSKLRPPSRSSRASPSERESHPPRRRSPLPEDPVFQSELLAGLFGLRPRRRATITSPAPSRSAARPTTHSWVSSAPVKAIVGVVLGDVLAAGRGGGRGRRRDDRGAVTGAAVTGVSTVLVGHVVAPTAAGAPQLGPLHEAVLTMVPVASDAVGPHREGEGVRRAGSHTSRDRPGDDGTAHPDGAHGRPTRCAGRRIRDQGRARRRRVCDDSLSRRGCRARVLDGDRVDDRRRRTGNDATARTRRLDDTQSGHRKRQVECPGTACPSWWVTHDRGGVVAEPLFRSAWVTV